MKLIAAIFFLLNAPVAVFLATILFGGITAESIKAELKSADIYKSATAMLNETTNEESGESDMAIMSFLQNRLTDTYVQAKTEDLIDDTESWITGKTTTPPTLSFKEVKDDIVAQNPELLTDLENAMTDLKIQQVAMAAESGEFSADDQAAMSEFQENNPLESMIKNDFTIPVGENLAGLKQFYGMIRIFLPILIGLLALSLAALYFLNHTRTSRLRWIGITLLISAIGGFGLAIFYDKVFQALKGGLLSEAEGAAAIVTPVISGILGLFFAKYKDYQMLVSIVFGISAILALLASFLYKDQPLTTASKHAPHKASKSSKKTK